jgi:hypothetical protein
MRNFTLKNCTCISSLLAMFAAAASGCSTGSSSPSGAAGSTGTPGAAGSNTGAAGSNTGAAGDSSGAAGSGTGTAGSSGAAGSGTGVAGATGAAGSSSGPSVCDGAGTRVLTSADGKVDNFEGAMLSTGWSTFNDVTPMNSFLMMQVAGGALGTGHAGHYAGTGAKTTMMGGFGVGAIYNEAIDTTAGIYCVDISAFDGITFWAKAATAGSKIDVNFVVPETNMVAADPTLGGGDCLKSCYNHPRKTITLTADWAQYSVAFADAAGGSAKVKNRIQELGWLSPDSNWDFSLDEIQLYKGTPPTTPVATMP